MVGRKRASDCRARSRWGAESKGPPTAARATAPPPASHWPTSHTQINRSLEPDLSPIKVQVVIAGHLFDQRTVDGGSAGRAAGLRCRSRGLRLARQTTSIQNIAPSTQYIDMPLQEALLYITAVRYCVCKRPTT